MRTLFTFVAMVSAVLVPWSSLAPAWLPDASGSAISPNTKQRRPAARICSDLGILPLEDELASEPEAEQPHEFAASGTAPAGSKVVCENGVCRLVNDPDFPSADSLPRTNFRLTEARRTLEQLGATQIRLDPEPTAGWRCSCSVPVSHGSKVMRRFEVTASCEDEAIKQACVSIQAWLTEHREASGQN